MPDSLVNRVALRYRIKQAGPSLPAILDTLADLRELADNIEGITNAFSKHFASGLDPQVRSQLEALQKARDGLKAARSIQESLSFLLTVYPADKVALRAQKDADGMVKRFTKLESEAAKMIRTLSSAKTSPALKAAAATLATKIRALLVDPKVLRVIPWQREAWRGPKGVIYQIILRIPETATGSLDLTLSEDTTAPYQKIEWDLRNERGGGYLHNGEYKSPADLMPKVREMLSGWDGLKGETGQNAKRMELAKILAPIIDFFCEGVAGRSEARKTEIEQNGKVLYGGFRGNVRYESYGDRGYDDANDEARRLTSDLRKRLSAYSSAIATISVGYDEKGHFSVGVMLK